MNEKLSLITELIKLAKSDKNLRDEEFSFIMTIAGRLGLSNSEVESIFSKYIDFIPPKLETDRIIQFYRLVLLMNIDQETNESEEEFVRNLGIKMGLNPVATETVLKEMKLHRDKGIPSERLVQIFTEYYN
ncbi:MAG: hypothetical protein JW894_00510 [Bacteroidales bacterium]|nr:hypothetical protein [Bacteroidales bacterium]